MQVVGCCVLLNDACKNEWTRWNPFFSSPAALDVKKQKDLSGFYRHLLNQTVGEEPVPDHSAGR